MAELSTRQLKAFLALVETCSFTQAARASHLSQPALSALIRQLEEALGLRLFDRSTRHVALTAEGAEFAVSARRLLAEFEQALGGMRELAQRARGQVAVALLPSLAAAWLPEVLAGFRARWPGVSVRVADVLSGPCVEQLRRGEADLALAAVPADSAELQAEPFCVDGFHLVCPADHPLARRRQVRPADLAEQPFIHLARNTSVRQALDAALHTLAPAARPQPGPEVEQLATVAGLVRAGLGVSVVPTLTLYQFQGPGLVTRPLHWPGLSRQIYLLRRRDRGLSVAAQAFHDWVRAHPPAP